MLELFIFHSENDNCLYFQKARLVAQTIQEKNREQLRLETYTTNSEMAKAYNCRGAIAVFLNQKMVDLEVATSKEKMEKYVNEYLNLSSHNSEYGSAYVEVDDEWDELLGIDN